VRHDILLDDKNPQPEQKLRAMIKILRPR